MTQPTDPVTAMMPPVRRATFSELDARTVYELIRLRIDVFVVEQACPYPELDGRDVEPLTEHMWVPDETGPVAYLRVLCDQDGSIRIGRVCTRRDVRHLGLASALVRDVLARHGGRPIVLAAQSYLVPFYHRHGFTRVGPDFIEDGIPHVPMSRTSDMPWR